MKKIKSLKNLRFLILNYYVKKNVIVLWLQMNIVRL